MTLSIFASKIRINRTLLPPVRIHIPRISLPAYAALLALILGSCNPTKYVAEDEYLLDKYKLRIDQGKVDQKELNSYVKPKPNKKILGARFYLGLYNLSGRKDNGWNRWLRKIGESPVLYDEFETDRNSKQLGLYMSNKGYYNAEVSDTVRFRKKMAQVTYAIDAGKPYTIRSIRYLLEDTSIQSVFYPDTVNRLIEREQNFDVDRLQTERTRIENVLRNQGYFNFSKEYIYYRVDSSLGQHQVDLTLGVKKFIVPSEDGYYLLVPHRKYRVEEVYIYPEYDPKQAIEDYQGYIDGLSRREFDDFIFLYQEKLRANPKVISQSVFILPGELYELEKVRQSQKHLSSLRIYKSVNIVFDEKDPYDRVKRDYYPLVCHIQLSPATYQSYTIELEGTNSSGNIGAGGNLNYQHRNLFGGAENFSARLSGGFEAITSKEYRGLITELGTEVRLTLPQLLLPGKTENFIRKYNPKTSIAASYSYQRRPEYTRSLMRTTFGYNWSGNEKVAHIFNPVQLNFVNMISATDRFLDDIRDTYLQHSYEDRLILASNYSLIFSNQNLKKTSDFLFFRSNLESAGFLLAGVADLANQPRDSLGRYVMFGNAFAQYLKGDVELRWYKPFNDKTSMVYRLFAGIAYPYGNSISIPFEKQYFSGGANGVRAWDVRNLGPGSTRQLPEDSTAYPNKTADIKLEFNIEYRFKLFWVLEGALFLDVGNIWAIFPDEEQTGASFSWDSFYRELAIGPGLGLRMDFSFFVLRADFGFKFNDPSLPEGERWLFPDNLDWPMINLAIGYPF